MNVKAVHVRPAPEPYGPFDCFWADREDGTTVDVSYTSCVEAEATPLIKFLSAVRNAIAPNVAAFVE